MSTPSMSSDVWGKSFAPQPAAAEARTAWTRAREVLHRVQSRWTQRLIMVQCAAALVTFFLVLSTHHVGVSLIYAGIVWALLWPLHYLVPRLTRDQGDAVANAERQVVEAEAAEAERFMSAANLGSYEWIAEEDVVLGVFPERGYLYYYGPHSRYEHLVLRADAVKNVTLVDRTPNVEESLHDADDEEDLASTAPTAHTRIERNGMFPMATTLRSAGTHCYMLEIEYRTPQAEDSAWLDVPFCGERTHAEEWRAKLQRAGTVHTV